MARLQPKKLFLPRVTEFTPWLTQRIQFAFYHSGGKMDHETGIRCAHLVAHRQSGKTDGIARLMQLFAADTLAEKKIFSLRGPVDSSYPKAAFIAKTQKQARGIIWNTMKDFLSPWNPKFNNSTLEATIPRPHIGDEITLELKSYRNADTLRGHKYRKIFGDEIQMATEEGIQACIIPTLTSVNGALFTTGTALPDGHYKPMIERSIAEGIPTALLPVHVTGVFNQAEQEATRKHVGEFAWQQEYLLNFNAPRKGTFYGPYITDLEKNEGFFSATRDKRLPLIMAMDLGIAEGLIGLLAQINGDRIEILDKVQGHDNLKEMREELENYDLFPDTIILPWDSNIRQIGKEKKETPKTLFREVFNECQIKQVTRGTVAAGIEKTRSCLHMLRFPPKDMKTPTDAHHVLHSLKCYSRKTDKDGRVTDQIDKTEGHDHAADALRYLIDFLKIQHGHITADHSFRAYGTSSNPINLRSNLGQKHGPRASLLDAVAHMPEEIRQQIPPELLLKVR